MFDEPPAGNGADHHQGRTLVRQGRAAGAIDLLGNNHYIRSVAFTRGKLPDVTGPTVIDLYRIR